MSFGGRSSVTYLELAEAAADRQGKWYADFSQGEVERMGRSIQSALGECWEYDTWPDLIEHLEATPVDGLVAWTGLGTPREVYDEHPLTVERAKSLDYKFGKDGIYLLDTPTGATVFVEHFPVVPTWKGDAWDVATAYLAGATVWHEATGDFWQCVTGNTGSEPADANANWRRLAILPRFFEAAVELAAAYEYRADRNYKGSAACRALGIDHLNDAVDLVIEGTGAGNRVV